MTKRHVTKLVTSFCPIMSVVDTSTTTLGASNPLTSYGFTADQVAEADSVLIEPHTAEAWIQLDGSTASAQDGHRIAQNQLRQLDYHDNLDDLRIFGTGAATLTLLKFEE